MPPGNSVCMVCLQAEIFNSVGMGLASIRLPTTQLLGRMGASPISARLTMYEQHERYFVLAVLTANRCGEHERMGNGENKSRFCPSYHLSLALIGASPIPTVMIQIYGGNYST